MNSVEQKDIICGSAAVVGIMLELVSDFNIHTKNHLNHDKNKTIHPSGYSLYTMKCILLVDNRTGSRFILHLVLHFFSLQRKVYFACKYSH